MNPCEGTCSLGPPMVSGAGLTLHPPGGYTRLWPTMMGQAGVHWYPADTTTNFLFQRTRPGRVAVPPAPFWPRRDAGVTQGAARGVHDAQQTRTPHRTFR